MKFRIGLVAVVFLTTLLVSLITWPKPCGNFVAVAENPVNPQPVWGQPAGTIRIGLVWPNRGPLRKVFLQAEDDVTFRDLGGKVYHFSPECEKEARRAFEDIPNSTSLDPKKKLTEVTLKKLQEEGFVVSYRRTSSWDPIRWESLRHPTPVPLPTPNPHAAPYTVVGVVAQNEDHPWDRKVLLREDLEPKFPGTVWRYNSEEEARAAYDKLEIPPVPIEKLIEEGFVVKRQAR